MAQEADKEPLGPEGLNRLVWRCRRGMLENDIFLERFFRRHGDTLTVGQSHCLLELMDLSDNDLLDLHLGRKSPAQIDTKLDRPEVIALLGLLQVNR